MWYNILYLNKCVKFFKQYRNEWKQEFDLNTYFFCYFFLQPVLYSYWRSSCSWRVRIALNLKEIPYDIKAVSLIKGGGEQHCNEYREVNPMEQVPSLCIGKPITV